MKYTKWTLVAVLAAMLGSCFKDEPKKEMRRAAGAWRIEKVTIQENDSLGNELSTSERSSVGMLMLNHDDEVMYQGTYSYSYDGAALASSHIHYFLEASDIWGLGVDGKTFNVGSYDPSTGYVTHIAGFTVLKLKRSKMELQLVHPHPVTGYADHIETWELERGTH